MLESAKNCFSDSKIDDRWRLCSVCVPIFGFKIKAQEIIQRNPAVGAAFNANVWQFDQYYLRTFLQL